MKRIAATATAVLFALTLAGCGASKGDQTACDLVANSNSTFFEAMTNTLDAQGDGKDFYRKLAITAENSIAGQIDLAINKAEDAKLLGHLSDLRNHWTDHRSGFKDSRTLYLGSLRAIADTCKALGANSTFKSLDDF